MPGAGDWPVPRTNNGAGMNMAQWVQAWENWAYPMMAAGWNIDDLVKMAAAEGEQFPKSLISTIKAKNTLFPQADPMAEYDLDNKMKRSFPHSSKEGEKGYGEWVPMEPWELQQANDYYAWRENPANYRTIDQDFRGNAYNAYLAATKNLHQAPGAATARSLGQVNNGAARGAARGGVSSFGAPGGTGLGGAFDQLLANEGDISAISAAEERLNLQQQMQRINERNLQMAGYGVSPDMQALLDMDRATLGYRNTTPLPGQLQGIAVTPGSVPAGTFDEGSPYVANTPNNLGNIQGPNGETIFYDPDGTPHTIPGAPGSGGGGGEQGRNDAVAASRRRGVSSFSGTTQPVVRWDPNAPEPTVPWSQNPANPFSPQAAPAPEVHGGPAQPPIRYQGDLSAPAPTAAAGGGGVSRPYTVQVPPTRQGQYELTHESFDPENIRADAFYNPEIERISALYGQANRELMQDPEIRRGGALAAQRADLRQQRLGAITDVYRGRTEGARGRIANWAQGAQYQQPVMLSGGQNYLEGRGQDIGLLNSREQRLSDAWIANTTGKANRLGGFMNLAGQLGSAYINSRYGKG